jgi:hypothetical protein
MNKRLLFFCILYLSLIASPALAQTTEANLKTYASQYEQERVHIHFDKDVYLPGETIWVKAYILSGSKPSNRSKNIYFDWTDLNGNLLSHNSSPVTEGAAASSFVIPAGFELGTVHIKAYTQWMLNFDNDFLYNKDIPVLTLWKGTIQQPEKQVASLRFFPEGGDLVTGLNSTLAFEATTNHGKPVNVQGVIKNSNNEIVDSFATVHDGMGSFKFRPAVNEKYTAIWKDESGESHTTALPEAKPTGAVVRIKVSSGNGIHFQVERPANGADNFKTITLIGTRQQQQVYKSVIDLKTDTLAEGTIPAEQLESGVMQVTVFDANMAPFSERVVFINNHRSEFAPQIKNEVVNLNKRGKNEISIEIPDSLASNLSVSVTDGGLGYDSSNHIITDFLLSSDIKGNIINPAFYLSNDADSTRFYLDLVMLTHGWRRFKWEELMAGKFPELKYSEENDYLNITGQIAAANTLFDNNDSIALLLVTRDRKKYVLSLPLSPDGSFVQKGMLFYDSVQIVYRVNHSSKLGSGSTINFQTSLLPASLSTVPSTNPGFEWIKVPDVILEKELNGALTEMRDYSRLIPGLNYVFSPNKNDSTKTGLETASHYLLGNFPGFKFPYASTVVSSSNTENRYASFSSNPAAQQAVSAAQKNNVNLSLDGVTVNMDDLKQIAMRDILFIKFLQKTSPKDIPVLSITTRQSVDQNNIINNKTGFAIVSGYTAAKEFYSPQYSDNVDDQATDYRSTIYWNPRVLLDKNHRKVKLVFYNNDISNKFRIVVEGFNKEGKLTRLEQNIK